MYVQDKTLGNRKGALTAFYKSIARIDSIVRSDTWTLFRKGVARYRGDAAKPKRAYTADIFYDSALTLLERYTCFDEIPIIALSYLTSTALGCFVGFRFGELHNGTPSLTPLKTLRLENISTANQQRLTRHSTNDDILQ